MVGDWVKLLVFSDLTFGACRGSRPLILCRAAQLSQWSGIAQAWKSCVDFLEPIWLAGEVFVSQESTGIGASNLKSIGRSRLRSFGLFRLLLF